MPLLAEERETQAWEGNSRTVQTRPDDPNEPPPSAQPRSEDDLNEVHMNSDDERSFQDTEQTTCVQETQLIDVEIDTQALDYSLSPVHRGPLNEENTHIRVVSAPVPQLALERTATKPAVTEEFFTRPATESLEEMNSGFKFGPAVRPKEGSYTRPLPGSKAREEQATNPSVPGAPKQTDSHMPIAEKDVRSSMHSRGSGPQSRVDTGIEPSLVSQNAIVAAAPRNFGVSESLSPAGSTQTTISSKRPRLKKPRKVISRDPAPRDPDPAHEHAHEQYAQKVQNGAKVMPQTHYALSLAPPHISTPSSLEPPVPLNAPANSSRTQAPPFPSLTREGSGPAPVQTQSAALRSREASSRRDFGGAHGGQGMDIENRMNCRLQERPRSANFNAHQQASHCHDNHDYDARRVGMIMENNELTKAEVPRNLRRRKPVQQTGVISREPNLPGTEVNEQPKADMSQMSRSGMPFPELEVTHRRSEIPEPYVDEPSNHQQARQRPANHMAMGQMAAVQFVEAEQPNNQQSRHRPSNQMANRPLPTAQLQSQSIPRAKVSEPKPKVRNPETANRNLGQPSQLSLNTKLNSMEMLQKLMFTAQTEQEQIQAAELKLQEQENKLGQFINENFALHRQLGSLQEEKHQLENEFVKLKSKSEHYKTHINEVARSQKHLEGLILKSNAKQDILLKEVEDRENAARKELREAGIQVEIFRSDLIKRMQDALKEARHQYDLLQQSHGQLKEELEHNATELSMERGRVVTLQKKLNDYPPTQEVFLQKLQEHFESVKQQLNDHEGKLSSIASGEETTKSKFDECLTILNTINAKETPTETPQPPALGGLVKMVETLSTSIENRVASEVETQSNLREAGRGLLDDLKERVEAMQTDQKAQEALNDRISSLREANAGLTEKLRAVEFELSQMKNQQVNLRGEFDTCRGHLTATKEELGRTLALPREDPAIRHQVQQLQNAKISLLSQVDELSKEAASAKEQLKNLSGSHEEETGALRDKLHNVESLVRGFETAKSKYEETMTAQSLQLRKELEQTLTQRLTEQNMGHENTQTSLRRKLGDALKELEECKRASLATSNTNDQLREELKEVENKLSYAVCSLDVSATEKAAVEREVDRVKEDLVSFMDGYTGLSNDIQSARGDVDCLKDDLYANTEDQANESSELIQKAQDEAEKEIGELKQRIATLEENLRESKRVESALGKYLARNDKLKHGDVHQWAESMLNESPETPNQRSSVQQVVFQEIQGAAQRAGLSVPHSVRSGRPRIAERNSVVNPSHMRGLDNLLMQRTEVTEFRVHTSSKTFESLSCASSPMTDLEPVFADKEADESGQGLEKALKRQRSMKPAQTPEARGTTASQVPKQQISKEQEAARRRTLRTPKGVLKRGRSESASQSSSQGSAADDGTKPSSAKGDLPQALQSKSVNILKGPSRPYTTSAYNRAVSGNGNGASRQQSSATKAGYTHSTLSRGSSLRSAGAITKSGENGDDHPAKKQRVSSLPERRPSKTIIPAESQESQGYVPSQDVF